MIWWFVRLVWDRGGGWAAARPGLAGRLSRAAVATSFGLGPASDMPVPSEVGSGGGHDHLVTESGLDFVVAARAPIGLDRLVRLHVAYVYWVVVSQVHVCLWLREQRPDHERGRHQNGSPQKHVVGTATDSFAIRVVAHVLYGTTRHRVGADGEPPTSSPFRWPSGVRRC